MGVYQMIDSLPNWPQRVFICQTRDEVSQDSLYFFHLQFQVYNLGQEVISHQSQDNYKKVNKYPQQYIRLKIEKMQKDVVNEITLKTFSSEKQLDWIVDVLRKELAQPYSIFTYNYFLTNWPQLTVMAYYKDELIGCIIGNYDTTNPRKAYIAMLVVLKEYRRLKIGQKLFDQFYKRVENNVDKIVLETECCNTAALNFYTKLGFFKTRRMENYYLSGNDAFRLKFYIPKNNAQTTQTDQPQQLKTQQ